MLFIILYSHLKISLMFQIFKPTTAKPRTTVTALAIKSAIRPNFLVLRYMEITIQSSTYAKFTNSQAKRVPRCNTHQQPTLDTNTNTIIIYIPLLGLCIVNARRTPFQSVD
eukprot:sb/3477144/